MPYGYTKYCKGILQILLFGGAGPVPALGKGMSERAISKAVINLCADGLRLC
jgi:hypothetical protein